MFAQFFAIAVAASAQAAPPVAVEPPARTTIVLLEPAPRVETEELRLLRAQVPKSASGPELLNVDQIADAMDYPKDASAKGEQGSVGAWLLIGADGRVARCGVERTSGSAALDGQTCDLLIANAKFRPATDRRGKAVASLTSQTIVWALEDGPTVDATMVRNTLIVGPDAQVRSCKAEFRLNDQWVEAPTRLCTRFLEEPNSIVLAARERSKRHDAMVVFDQIGLSDPAEAMPMPGSAPGEVLVFLRSAVVQFAPDGTRVSCTPGETVGFLEQVPSLCGAGADGVSFSGGESKPANLRLKTAVYLTGEPN